MKHQIGGTGWPSRNILDFHVGLPTGWGANTFENGWLWFFTQAEAESVILFLQLALPKICIWIFLMRDVTLETSHICLSPVTKCHAGHNPPSPQVWRNNWMTPYRYCQFATAKLSVVESLHFAMFTLPGHKNYGDVTHTSYHTVIVPPQPLAWRANRG